MDENKRSLLTWFINHFWGRVVLTLALLAALGFVLGGYRLPLFMRAYSVVSIMDLNRHPARYEAKAVCVKGQVLDLRVEDNRLVRPYAVFSLQETAPDGSFDFINIISLRLPAFEKGAEVKACGYFNKVKQVGRDTYYDSLLMSRFELEKAAVQK